MYRTQFLIAFCSLWPGVVCDDASTVGRDRIMGGRAFSTTTGSEEGQAYSGDNEEKAIRKCVLYIYYFFTIYWNKSSLEPAFFRNQYSEIIVSEKIKFRMSSLASPFRRSDTQSSYIQASRPGNPPGFALPLERVRL